MSQQQYRLRLSAGTLLVVDYDALTTWLMDEKALVQAVGGTRWRRLKHFLADERAGIGSNFGEVVPEVDLPTAVPTPEVESPSLSVAESTPLELPAEPEAFDPDAIVEPSLPLGDSTPWEWAAEQDHAAAPETPEASAVPVAPVAPPPEPDPVPQLDPAPEPEIDITVSRLLAPPEVVRVPEPVAPALSVVEEAAPADELPNLEITVSRRLPIDDADAGPQRSSRGAPRPAPEPDPIVEAHDIEPVLSEEAAALHAATQAWLLAERDQKPMIVTRAPRREVVEPRDIGAPRGVQTLADDPTTPGVTSGPEIPILRLKPLESPPSTRQPIVEEEEPIAVHGVDWGPGLVGRILRPVAEWSEALTEWMNKRQMAPHRSGGYGTSIADSLQRLRVRTVDGLGRGIAGSQAMLVAWRELISGWLWQAKSWSERRRDADRVSLSLSLHEERPVQSARPARTVPPPPEPVPAAAPLPRVAPPQAAPLEVAPRQATPPRAAPKPQVAPPLAISELPTIRFKDEVAAPPAAIEDLYAGDDVSGDDEAGLLETLLIWGKRILLTAAIAACGFIAFRTRDRWLPGAERRSNDLFVAIRKRLDPPRPEVSERAEEQRRQDQRQELLRASVSQMPYLSPDTIDRVVANLSGGLGDIAPEDVFRRAYEAIERGLATLPQEEAAELQGMRDTMLESLPASERQHIINYEPVLRARVTLPYEDRTVMTLLARASTALPPEGRARLQELSGKAVVAALSGATVPPPPTAVSAAPTP